MTDTEPFRATTKGAPVPRIGEPGAGQKMMETGCEIVEMVAAPEQRAHQAFHFAEF